MKFHNPNFNPFQSISKRLRSFFLIVVSLFFVLRVQAQDIPSALTGVGLGQLVNSTINNLTNAGATLLGDGSITINGASANLSALLNQFNAEAGENIAKPINELSNSLKNLANQLYSVSSRLNVILNQQQSCLILNAQTVIASVQTVVSELKSGVPIISKDAPRLSYFQFDGHSPTVVPQKGGRITITGYRLWPTSALPPVVTIYDETRQHILITVTPQRGENNNSFSFLLDSNKLKTFAGQNLQIEVTPKERTWLFFTKSLGTYFLPMSLPSSFSTQLQVVAHVQYTCKRDMTQTLDYRAFNFDNSSCGNRINVTHTETWVLPPGGVIVSISQRSLDANNDHNISVNAAGASITAAGWIDSPTCINLFFGQKLVKSTWWHEQIAPVVAFQVNDIFTADGRSDLINMEAQTTNLMAPVISPCPAPSSMVYWFDIFKKNGDVLQKIYTSPQTIGTNIFADDWQGLSINASINTVPVGNANQLAVKVTQAVCGL